MFYPFKILPGSIHRSFFLLAIIPEPAQRVPDKCPKDKFDCGADYENDEDQEPNYYDPYNGKFDDVVEHFGTPRSETYYIISFLLVICIILLCIIFVVVILFLRGKHGYGYGHGSSFANPNYYSPNNESVATNSTNSNMDKRQFIWKRLKYDKSQVRILYSLIRLSFDQF